MGAVFAVLLRRSCTSMSHGCRFCLCLGVMPEAAHSEQYAEPLSETLKYEMLNFNPGFAGYCRSSLTAM